MDDVSGDSSAEEYPALMDHRSRAAHTAYYDAEAPRYDESRGGAERVRATAEALLRLVPAAAPGSSHLDVAGGTGSISALVAEAGYGTCVLDGSTGMLRIARARGISSVCGDATALPFPDASFALVTEVWLLHLLTPEDAAVAIDEIARVLRPGGTAIVSVDKQVSHGGPVLEQDHEPVVAERLARHGLTIAGTATFEAPSPWGAAEGRTDPVFHLAAFRRP